MNKSRDIGRPLGSAGTDDAIRPLNARSLALSALLGTHPPALPARALVDLAELFGIAPGTMRTALSRMVANGEATVDEGWYRLAGPLLDRQLAQDTGRRPARSAWDGTWHTVVAVADQRTVAERRQFRRVMADHRFAELRPDIWMRPGNLPGPPAGPDWMTVTGTLVADDPSALVARLWDLDAIAASAHRLLARLDDVDHPDGGTDDADRSIPTHFETAAAVLRFLRGEPLLPPDLTGPEWPVDELRVRYAEVEDALQRRLRSFFRRDVR